MKSQWVVLLFALASTAMAQTGNRAQRPLGFSQNGSPVIEMHTESSDPQDPLWTSGSVVAEHGNPHRVVLDRQDRILFAYDIQLRKVGSDAVVIKIDPIDQRKIRGERWFSRYRSMGEIPTLATGREYPPLKPGDRIELEILHNAKTGTRIYDILEVASGSSPFNVVLRSAGEKFTLYRAQVNIDGKTIGQSNGLMVGEAIKVHIPERGNYYLTLSRTSRLPLRAAGWVDHKILRFLAGADVVEIVGERNVLEQSALATVWVYYEPESDGEAFGFECGGSIESLVRRNKAGSHRH